MPSSPRTRIPIGIDRAIDIIGEMGQGVYLSAREAEEPILSLTVRYHYWRLHPSEEYKEEDAREAKEDANFIVEIARRVI